MKYTRQGMELLATGILKNAYNELIDARLADAASEFRDISYNCNLKYGKMKKNRSKYFGKTGKKMVEHDIEELEKWFLSDECAVYCVNVHGKWFVETAKKKARDFALDKIPEWQALPTYDTTHGTGGNVYGRRRDLEDWKAKRDKWRKEHGLGKVRDGQN